MMCPPPAGRITASAASVPFIAPSAFTSSSRRLVLPSCVHDGPVASTPALFTHTASPPGRAAATCTRAPAGARRGAWRHGGAALLVAHVRDRGPATERRRGGRHGRLINISEEYVVPQTAKLGRYRQAKPARRPGDHRRTPTHGVDSSGRGRPSHLVDST